MRLLTVWIVLSTPSARAEGGGDLSCPCIDAMGTGFGAVCQPWNKESPECLIASPAEWCEDQWCFVDEACERMPRTSTYENLFHSYVTHGPGPAGWCCRLTVAQLSLSAARGRALRKPGG